MLSHLELLPSVILEHIAFQVVTPDAFSPPQSLLHFMLSSSTIYHSLSLSAAPHLYANIFRECFDLGAIRRQSSFKMTDSWLAAELVSRYRLLRRVRRHDLSNETLRSDFCTAMRMLLESDGLNEARLWSIGFVRFIAGYLEHCLEKRLTHHFFEVPADDNIMLAMELFVLTLSQAEIASFSQETRDKLLLVSRPFILSVLKKSAVAKSPRAYLNATVPSNEENKIAACDESNNTQPSLHDPTATPCHGVSAAIILTFALKELDIPQIPPHLPLDRTTAVATGRSGPTQQDYQVVANYKTPLFGDDRPVTQDSSRSARHGPGFHFCEDSDWKNPSVPGSEPNANAYTSLPCLLTGAWEGIYMISSSPQPKCSGDTTESAILSDFASPSTPDFLCRAPMQCSLSLFFCFDTQAYQDLGSLGFAGDIHTWTIGPSKIIATEDCLAVAGRRLSYEKFVLDSSRESQVSRDPSQAIDCVIIGQTSEEHEQAWGAYKFAGRLFKDGKIALKREPKNTSDEGFGNWIFEGYLRFGAAFVGVWKSGESGESCGVEGIFSLRKTE